MTEVEFKLWLAADVRTYGSQKEAARVYGISPAYLTDILKGNREPSQKILDYVGYERIVSYQRKEPVTE